MSEDAENERTVEMLAEAVRFARRMAKTAEAIQRADGISEAAIPVGLVMLAASDLRVYVDQLPPDDRVPLVYGMMKLFTDIVNGKGLNAHVSVH